LLLDAFAAAARERAVKECAISIVAEAMSGIVTVPNGEWELGYNSCCRDITRTIRARFLAPSPAPEREASQPKGDSDV